MQLHDFSELNEFPCNLKRLCICLSEVIFLEAFMRRIYGYISSVHTLHIIGTIENSSVSTQEENDNYETINISKIRAHAPNLRVINLYGISFVDDSHVEAIASGCIHLQCLALNFCVRVIGTSFKNLIIRCGKLQCLLLQNTGENRKE
jgi:anti-anti-sigma regulatory factor